MDKKITISMEFYQELLIDSFIYNRLRVAGLDNWDGYSEAFENYDEELEEYLKKYINENIIKKL